MLLGFYSCDENYYIKKANQYEQHGEHEKAIEYFDKALTQNSENYDVYIDKGLITSDLGKDLEAISIFTKAIEISPKKGYAYYCRAESYMRLEKYEEAINDYNSALNIVVGNDDKLRKPIEGVHNDFVSVADIEPYSIYADRGVAYYFLDSLELAWKDLNLCINNSKELAQCYYWRGIIYHKRGHENEGCKDLFISSQMGYQEATSFYQKYCECDNKK